MKKTFTLYVPRLIIPILILSLSILRASPFLPTDKKAVKLEPGERNPFSQRAPATSQITQPVETEEFQIRSFLSTVLISGYTESTTSRSILLAGRRITVGDILTDLVEGQTERILVENILPDRIEFAFLEPENRPITRRFSLPFNLQPTVRYLLPTQSPVNKPPVPNLHGRYPPKNEGVSDHQLPH